MTEQATGGGLQEPSENRLTTTIVIFNIAAQAGMAGSEVAVPMLAAQSHVSAGRVPGG